MKKLIIIALLSVAWVSTGALAQEHEHETGKPEEAAGAKKAAEPAKSEKMKCCEGMEKMGEMKAGMPMKKSMTPEMKTKMTERMQKKTADKAEEKKSSDLPSRGEAEKAQPNPDAHQH